MRAAEGRSEEVRQRSDPVRQERKLRIEVGYGLEGTVTDAFSSDVIRSYIAPRSEGRLCRGAERRGGRHRAIEGKEAPVPVGSVVLPGFPSKTYGR